MSDPEAPLDPAQRAPDEGSDEQRARASVPSAPRDSSPGRDKGKRKRPRRRAMFSAFLLVIIAVVAIVARTEWAAKKTVATIAQQVRAATGLELTIGRAGWSWRRLAVHAEAIEVRHPTEGLLARVDWADLRPSLRSVFKGNPTLSAIEIDGGEIRVVFKNGRLANGPVVKPGPPPPPGPPQLPFRDVAVSDLRVRIEHDQVGNITLDSVDLDLRNENNQRLLIGVLSRGGSVASLIRSPHTGEPCFSGPIRRIEARAELRNFSVLRVGAAHIEALDTEAHVSDALVPLSMRELIRASVRARVPLSVATCPLPRLAPMINGEATVDAQASFNPVSMGAEVRGHVSTRGVTITILDQRPLGRNGTFGAGQSIELDFHGTERALHVDRLEARYAGGRVFAPSRRTDRPLIFTLQPRLELAGSFETQGLRFEQLMRELSVTDFAKVLWSIDAVANITLLPDRLALPPDRARPALHLDVDADTRDFAIVKDFHRWGPPHEPVIAIPRGRVQLQMDLDPTHVRFRDMRADFGHTHVDGDEVEVRTVHDPALPDMIVRNIRSSHIDLADVGHIAGIPIAGTAEAVVNGGGPFSDIIVTGTTRVRNYQFAGLPIGDVETAPGRPWQLRGITLRGPELIVRQGRSTFNAHNALLDFSRYTLVASAHIESSDAQLADYYRMFEFTGDPVFEPYTGGTMQDCSLPTHDRTLPRSECWVSDTARPRSRRGDERPSNARARHGFVAVDVEYVLGRPGDDPKGTLHADVRGWDLAVHAFDETIQHADLHATYDWLLRDRGFRGSRLAIDYARGRVANGTVEAGGNVDLGGRMHLTAAVRNADLGRLDLTRGMNLRGTVDGTGVIEGTPESQRWSMDADIRDLGAAQRDFGGVRLRVRSTPDPTGRLAQEAINERLTRAQHAPVAPATLPDPQRWSLVADAINGALRIDGSLLVPFVQEPWRDSDGNWQRDFARSWRDAVMQGSVELSQPNASGARAAVDMVPWLPARLIARLGSTPVARAALRLDIDELSLRDPTHARGQLALNTLDLSAMGVRVALPTNAPLALCANDGRLWIDPAAANASTARTVCAAPPRGLFTNVTQTRATALPVAHILGPEGVDVSLSGGATVEGTLALSVAGSVSLERLAQRFSSLVQDAHGDARFSVRVGGNVEAPELRGLVELDSGSLRVSALPQPIDDLDLRIRLEGTQVSLERARANFGSSNVDLSGGMVRFRGRDLERVDVPLIVRNLALTPSNGIEIALDTDARLMFADGDPLPSINGVVTLNRARYTRPIDMSIISENGSGGAPAPDEPYDPSRDRVQLALELRAREPVRIRNNLIDADVALSTTTPFRIVGTDQRPSVLGSLSIPRGRVFFRGNEFEVRRSRIEFDNPERISPAFDVLATTDIRRSSESAGARNQWRIDLHAYGSTDRFALDMSAEPSLSREDIALMLAFRMTRAELDQLGTTDLGQILAVEALSNITGIDRIVRRNVPLISDFNITSGYSPAQGRTVPQVSVRVPLAPGVRAGATVNITEQREVRGTIDYDINRQHSLQVGIDNYGQTGSQNRAGAVNGGLDWRFRLDFE